VLWGVHGLGCPTTENKDVPLEDLCRFDDAMRAAAHLELSRQIFSELSSRMGLGPH
jgi:hypothetical protein